MKKLTEKAEFFYEIQKELKSIKTEEQVIAKKQQSFR